LFYYLLLEFILGFSKIKTLIDKGFVGLGICVILWL